MILILIMNKEEKTAISTKKFIINGLKLSQLLTNILDHVFVDDMSAVKTIIVDKQPIGNHFL